MLPTQNKCKKLGPFSKICIFRNSWRLAIMQKRSTSPMHKFLNFDSLKVFLDFLESLRCPLRNHSGMISIFLHYSFWFGFDSLEDPSKNRPNAIFLCTQRPCTNPITCQLDIGPETCIISWGFNALDFPMICFNLNWFNLNKNQNK